METTGAPYPPGPSPAYTAPSRVSGSALPRTGRAMPMVEEAPDRLAGTLMAAGAFLVGYQALRVGAINFTLSDLAFVLAFAVCLTRGQITGKPFGAMTPAWIAALALMLTGLMIGTVAHGDMSRWAIVSLQYLFGYLLLPLMLLHAPLWFAQRLVCMFLLGVAILEAVGIAVSLTLNFEQANAFLTHDFLAGNGRLSSFASEPNWNGEVIAFAGPLALYAFTKRLINLWAFIGLVALLLWALLLSASFTGFVAFTIGMTITLLFMGIRVLFSVALVSAVAAGIFASGAPLPSVFQERVGGALTDGDLESAGTYRGRVELIDQAWETAEDTIVVGLGVDGFRTTNEVQQPVHNLFMLMLVDGGVLAFAGFSLLVAMLFIMPLGHIGTARIEAGAALAMGAVFSIYTLSMPHMFSRLNIVPVVFGLMLVYVRDRRLIQKM